MNNIIVKFGFVILVAVAVSACQSNESFLVPNIADKPASSTSVAQDNAAVNQEQGDEFVGKEIIAISVDEPTVNGISASSNGQVIEPGNQNDNTITDRDGDTGDGDGEDPTVTDRDGDNGDGDGEDPTIGNGGGSGPDGPLVGGGGDNGNGGGGPTGGTGSNGN